METTDAKKRREERELADRTRLDEFTPDAARGEAALSPANETPKACRCNAANSLAGCTHGQVVQPPAPDPAFCATHPAVGREFCGCPAPDPDETPCHCWYDGPPCPRHPETPEMREAVRASMEARYPAPPATTGPADEAEGLAVCYPGQCCNGYCVGDLLHDLRKDQADRLVEILAARDARTRADAWDECAQALAWCLDNGPSSAAVGYLLANNPHRSAR